MASSSLELRLSWLRGDARHTGGSCGGAAAVVVVSSLPTASSESEKSASAWCGGAYGVACPSLKDVIGAWYSRLTWQLNVKSICRHKFLWSISCSLLPKKDILIVLPYLGLHSNQVTKRLKSCVNNFYSRSYSKTHAASNPFFHTKIAWTDLRGPKSSIKLAAGTVTNSTLAKQNEDSMTEKQNTSKLSRKVTIHQPLLII